MQPILYLSAYNAIVIYEHVTSKLPPSLLECILVKPNQKHFIVSLSYGVSVTASNIRIQ